MLAKALIAMLLFFPALHAENRVVRGVVKDPTGAVIVGADVALGDSRHWQSDSHGEFSFDLPQGETATLTVRAQGFTAQSIKVGGQAEGKAFVEIILRPATAPQQTTVVSTRTKLPVDESAASVRVLSQEDFRSTAALTLDNALGQIAGFNLFRRSGSRTANPTTQGVSFRGTGGSGASRAVLLYDGVPQSDPFGGWIYWDRIPRESIDRIEVLQGAASDLYGSNALGGVVSVIPRRYTGNAISLETSYGNERTPNVDLAASGRLGQWVASAEGGLASTDGYFIVGQDQRGLVDTKATSEYRNGIVSLERLLRNDSRIFFRGSSFGEDRGNGTALQINSTVIRQLVFGADYESPAAGSFSFRGFGGPQHYHQTFSSVAANRNSESLTDIQDVPAEQAGLSAQWSRPFGARQVLLAGAEGHDIHGDTREVILNNGKILRTTDAGGHQRISGFYTEYLLKAGQRWLFTLAGRFDSWRNFDALSTVMTPGPKPTTTVTSLRTTDETAFSPRASLAYKLNNNISLHAAGYRAFRAPTLNELYRAFRVGNVLTLANDNLQAEHATGGEAGANLVFLNQKLVLHSNFFWTLIDQPVANVTLITTPALITRQRQNLGRTQSRGFELQAEARITSTISLSTGYQFADATVERFSANPALESLAVPQVPRQQFTLQLRRATSRYIFALQTRAVGTQFDDDQNLLPLAPYVSIDGFASRSMGHGTEIFVAAENLLNQRFEVSRTPVTTLGPPILVRVGLRLNLFAR